MASAPVWQSSTIVAGSNGTSCIYTLPASIAADDIVVLQLYKENTAAATPPAGFTELTSVQPLTPDHQQKIFWKRMAGGESGTVTVSWTGSAFRSGTAHRITGCVTTGDPWGAFFTTAADEEAGADLILPAVSLTGTPAASLLFWGATDFAGATTVWTPASGFTERNSNIVLVAGTKDNTAGGDTGTLTGSVNTGAGAMTAFLGALSSPPDTTPGGPWFTSPLAETPYAEKRAPWEFRPNQPPIPMRVWTSPPDPPPGDQSISLDDTAAGSDALAVTADVALSDTASAADALTVAAAAPLSDTATADDALTVTAALPLTDTAAGSDALSVAAAIPLSDTASAADALSAGVPISLSDTATAVDSLSITVTLALAETAAADDALSVLAPGVVDAYQAGPQIARMFLDPSAASIQLAGSRQVAVSGDQSISLSDTATASDSLTIAAAVPLAETASAADALAVTVALALADTATAVETMAAGVPISLTDTGAAVDALSVQITGLSKTLTDTASATDALSITVALALADTATAVEAISIPEAAVANVVSRISTGHQMSRASTGTDARRVSTGAQMSRASTGTDARRIATGHQMSRIVSSQEE